MKIENYVLLGRKGLNEAAPVRVRDLRLSFSRLSDGSLRWSADAGYELRFVPDCFCGYSGEQTKPSEIQANSLEEFMLKLAAAGLVYGS